MRYQPAYKPGDRIGGRYLVSKALAGGMGEVYLCLDEQTGLPFALKTFQSRFQGRIFQRSRILDSTGKASEHRALSCYGHDRPPSIHIPGVGSRR
jgi:hypothetical protein